MNNKVASYFNDGTHNDETYRILDGNVSIGEAVTYFEKDYLSSLPCDFDSNYSIYVSTIDVYNIHDDIYCYVFQFSTAWNSIPSIEWGKYSAIKILHINIRYPAKRL